LELLHVLELEKAKTEKSSDLAALPQDTARREGNLQCEADLAPTSEGRLQKLFVSACTFFTAYEMNNVFLDVVLIGQRILNQRVVS
jgi:hypothetical protein